jgi:hypothetical protein
VLGSALSYALLPLPPTSEGPRQDIGMGKAGVLSCFLFLGSGLPHPSIREGFRISFPQAERL